MIGLIIVYCIELCTISHLYTIKATVLITYRLCVCVAKGLIGSSCFLV